MQIRFHSAGTIVVIEGPRFSTKAESHLYRSWNAQLVGMTTVPEAVLAKELGLHYAVVSVITDYDCWRESHEPVFSLFFNFFLKSATNSRRVQ